MQDYQESEALTNFVSESDSFCILRNICSINTIVMQNMYCYTKWREQDEVFYFK